MNRPACTLSARIVRRGSGCSQFVYLQQNGADLVGELTESRAGPTVYVRDPDRYVLEIRILRD